MLSMQRPRAGQPSGYRNRGVDNCGAMAHQHCYGRAYITRLRVETTSLYVGAASKKFRHINAGFFRADCPIVRPFPSVPSVSIAPQSFSARFLTGTVEGGSSLQRFVAVDGGGLWSAFGARLAVGSDTGGREVLKPVLFWIMLFIVNHWMGPPLPRWLDASWRLALVGLRAEQSGLAVLAARFSFASVLQRLSPSLSVLAGRCFDCRLRAQPSALRCPLLLFYKIFPIEPDDPAALGCRRRGVPHEPGVTGVRGRLFAGPSVPMHHGQPARRNEDASRRAAVEEWLAADALKEIGPQQIGRVADFVQALLEELERQREGRIGDYRARAEGRHCGAVVFNLAAWQAVIIDVGGEYLIAGVAQGQDDVAGAGAVFPVGSGIRPCSMPMSARTATGSVI